MSSPIDDLIFYDIFCDNSIKGTIQKSNKYSNYYNKKRHYLFKIILEMKISFSVQYKDLWYPLLKNNGKLDNYNEIYFENWEEIKEQAWKNYYKWIDKINKIHNSYKEIRLLEEFPVYEKSYDFYKNCEEIIRRNLNIGVMNFKTKIDSFKNEAESNEITFEGLAYHIMNNTNNILHSLHNSFPLKIKNRLKKDFEYYNISFNDEDKNLALYNYILN